MRNAAAGDVSGLELLLCCAEVSEVRGEGRSGGGLRSAAAALCFQLLSLLENYSMRFPQDQPNRNLRNLRRHIVSMRDFACFC